jgi:NADPH:quinone reductase-like Zn-dependent oxidoreductase
VGTGFAGKKLKRHKMKAAVIYQQGELPQYADFPEPVAQNDEEIRVAVKAVAIKHFDKGRAAGRHYSSDTPKAGGRVVGGDGVCLLEDGTRVYGLGMSGMLAEKAIIRKDRPGGNGLLGHWHGRPGICFQIGDCGHDPCL